MRYTSSRALPPRQCPDKGDGEDDYDAGGVDGGSEDKEFGRDDYDDGGDTNDEDDSSGNDDNGGMKLNAMQNCI